MKARSKGTATSPTATTLSAAAPASLQNTPNRDEILNRLKRAEGQLRGIQRMIEEGSPCLSVATQMAAVRKALDSTYVRITVCFMEQQMRASETTTSAPGEQPSRVMADIETLLGKIR